MVAAYKRSSLPGTGGRLEYVPALRKSCGGSAGKDALMCLDASCTVS